MISTKPAVNQLYLSRLRLNPMNRAVMRCMNNSQDMHTLLLGGFPASCDRNDHNLLYRIDPVRGSHDGLVDIIVQSTIEPDWAHLRERDLLIHESEFFGDGLVKNISSLPNRLQINDVFRFRLRANPTKRVPWDRWAMAYPEKARAQIERAQSGNASADPRKLNGPRISVTDYTIDALLWQRDHPGEDYEHPKSSDEMLMEWIQKQGQNHGFILAQTQCLPDPVMGDMQHGEKTSGTKLSHKAMVFDGLLKVTEIDSFRKALIGGIGSGKAYGFGLISLAPVGGL